MTRFPLACVRVEGASLGSLLLEVAFDAGDGRELLVHDVAWPWDQPLPWSPAGLAEGAEVPLVEALCDRLVAMEGQATQERSEGLLRANQRDGVRAWDAWVPPVRLPFRAELDLACGGVVLVCTGWVPAP